MNNKELANFLQISEQALYKWKKNRPNLWKIANFYKEHINNSLENKNEKTKLLFSLFEKLTNEEQEYYLTDMKARLLKKEIDKNQYIKG